MHRAETQSRRENQNHDLGALSRENQVMKKGFWF